MGYLACGDRGPALIERRSHAIRKLPSGDLPDAGGTCETKEFAGDNLIQISTGEAAAHTDFVSYAGKVESYPAAWI